MQTSGIESSIASVSPVTMLVAPGPDVTRTQPTLPEEAGIALGCVHRPLLVAHEDVLHRVLVKQRVVDRKHRAAGIAEERVHALILERPMTISAPVMTSPPMSVSSSSRPVSPAFPTPMHPAAGNKKGPRGTLHAPPSGSRPV